MDLLHFLQDNYLTLVPALWVLGFALKQTPGIPNWAIIWILLIVSLSFAFFAFGVNYDSLLNGIIAPGVAVFGHQLYKQTVNRDGGKKKD